MSREVELAIAHAGCVKRSCLFICLRNTRVSDSTAQQQPDVAWCHPLQVAVQHKRSRSGIVIGKQFLPPLTHLASDVGRIKSKVPAGTDVSTALLAGHLNHLPWLSVASTSKRLSMRPRNNLTGVCFGVAPV